MSVAVGTVYIVERINLGDAFPLSSTVNFVVTKGGTNPFSFVTNTPPFNL
jgi:hypothetical protein